MRPSTKETIYEHWNHPCYEVTVRGTIYLWGSAGITRDLDFSNALVLHVRNDPFGEAVTLGTQVSGGAKTTIGTLQPGECVSLPMQKISGVFAICAKESTVACLIKD